MYIFQLASLEGIKSCLFSFHPFWEIPSAAAEWKMNFPLTAAKATTRKDALFYRNVWLSLHVEPVDRPIFSRASKKNHKRCVSPHLRSWTLFIFTLSWNLPSQKGPPFFQMRIWVQRFPIVFKGAAFFGGAMMHNPSTQSTLMCAKKKKLWAASRWVFEEVVVQLIYYGTPHSCLGGPG